MQPKDLYKETGKISKTLGETNKHAKKLIRLIIGTCGLEFAQKIVEETEAIEAQGGMKTKDQTRRRSKGGVFFYIVKDRLDTELRQEIFPNQGKNTKSDMTFAGIEWSERINYLKPLLEDPGQVNTLSVTLTGRPGKLHIEGGTVMTVIEQKKVKTPSHPKGVPPLESVEKTTCYHVLMDLKQWKSVEQALEDKSDLLVVIGTAIYDSELEGISILSTSLSTQALERQKQLKMTPKQVVPTQKANQKKVTPTQAKHKSAPKAKPQKVTPNLPPSV